MALIACRECNREISSEAKTCPHCGIKIKKVVEPKKNTFLNKKIVMVFGVILILAVIVIVSMVHFQNRWKSAIEYKYIGIENYNFSENLYRSYEVTNVSDKTLKNVRVRIKVDDILTDFTYTDYVTNRLEVGETVEYKLSRHDEAYIEARERNNPAATPDSDALASIEIIGFTYE
jgi:hypothetical protein